MASGRCEFFQIICTYSMSLQMITYASALFFQAKLVTEIFLTLISVKI